MNRLTHERVLTVSVGAVGLATCAATMWWASRPSPSVEPSMYASAVDDAGPATRIALEASAFDRDLWFERSLAQPEAPARVEDTPEEKQPPERAVIALTLVAIIRQGDRLSAALYDSSEQQIVFVDPESRIGDVLVQRITDQAVVLELHGREQQLALFEEGR